MRGVPIEFETRRLDFAPDGAEDDRSRFDVRVPALDTCDRTQDIRARNNSYESVPANDQYPVHSFLDHDLGKRSKRGFGVRCYRGRAHDIVCSFGAGEAFQGSS